MMGWAVAFGVISLILRYGAGAEALAEIGIGGLPDDWPAHAAVYGCSSIDRRHWLLLLPERAQLWLGWSG